jgi:homoserine O-acetyltransferase
VAIFGELNAAKDNAILVTTWYSGTHQSGATPTSAPSTR